MFIDSNFGKWKFKLSDFKKENAYKFYELSKIIHSKFKIIRSKLILS